MLVGLALNPSTVHALRCIGQPCTLWLLTHAVNVAWLGLLQESVRVKVIRRALEQLNSAMRQHKGMAKNPLSGSIMAMVSGVKDGQ